MEGSMFYMLHSGKLGEHTDVQFTEVGFCLGKIEVQKSQTDCFLSCPYMV